MATKNYMINDKWLDLDKQNIVELQSVDGVLDSLKVNGSEIETPSGKITITENGTDIDIAQYALADVNVEGGGGSSDFSTAEVSVVNNTGGSIGGVFVSVFDTPFSAVVPMNILSAGTKTYNVPLYKGSCYWAISDTANVSVSGDIEWDSDNRDAFITGDCTIIIS